jgi:hypothetical protein
LFVEASEKGTHIKTITAGAKKSTALKQDIAATYNRFKEFEGRTYTGMAVGRSHKWYYDQGEWKEKKITPDKWEINYAVKKRRAAKAPEGSGVPAGTEYHWYILAHQIVTKLNANDYATSMTGIKYKLAHKRADHDTWSASTRAQRKRLIKLLEEMIQELQHEAEEEEEKPIKIAKARKPRNGQLRKRAG